MASLNGLFPCCLRPRREFSVRSWLGLLSLGALLPLPTAFAAPPPYLQEALTKFIPAVPRDWAYTVKTEAADRQTVERFDPAKPPAEQWSLLLTNGRAPTEEEQAKYFKFKAGQVPGPTEANFQKGDIEPGSFRLLREDGRRAEYLCAFREQAANSDKMLAHLSLRLTVAKQPAHVEKFALELRETYSPVLGVRMRELAVEMLFSPPEGNRPALPLRSSSHFAGRIFLIPLEENLRLTYSDFAPPPPARP